MQKTALEKLGLGVKPALLAPLAGVSDHPFRRICAQKGAALTYVEMISATALVHQSVKTLEMLDRHPSEDILGVQITSKSPEEMGQAVAILDKMNFETIDINMGCPVKKVVKSGCGSAILREPQRVYDTVKAACQNTQKPVSAKIRLGWDHQSLNYLEVCDAIGKAGAQWITVHGRTRSDSYADPVDLDKIGEIKTKINLPIIANGNIFSFQDYQDVLRRTGVDGVMISRGALGNPWLFQEICQARASNLSLADWLNTIFQHLAWQLEAYGNSPRAKVCMRKHYVWYAKGWPSARLLRENLSKGHGEDQVQELLQAFVQETAQALGKDIKNVFRSEDHGLTGQNRFLWDPKWDMDRQFDSSGNAEYA